MYNPIVLLSFSPKIVLSRFVLIHSYSTIHKNVSLFYFPEVCQAIVNRQNNLKINMNMINYFLLPPPPLTPHSLEIYNIAVSLRKISIN